MRDSPIFTRLHDLMLWLLQTTRKFPREHRFGLAHRLEDQAFDLQHALVAAAIDNQYAEDHLIRADVALTDLRKTLLLCQELGLLQAGQYRHVGEMAAEIGRLLGGWRSTDKTRVTQPKHRVADAGTGSG
jgi:hypothetical protein